MSFPVTRGSSTQVHSLHKSGPVCNSVHTETLFPAYERNTSGRFVSGYLPRHTDKALTGRDERVLPLSIVLRLHEDLLGRYVCYTFSLSSQKVFHALSFLEYTLSDRADSMRSILHA